MKKEDPLMAEALVAQDPAKERRLLQLRSHIEMFRGALCVAEPFFMGIRLMLEGIADMDEIRKLVDSYVAEHDDRGTIGSCLVLKAAVGHRLPRENAWYQEWHPFHDQLEALYWNLPVKRNVGGPEEQGLAQYVPTLEDAKYWIVDQIAACWQVEKTEDSMRAFRFLMATFGAAAGETYAALDREYCMPDGYGHFNSKLIERIRHTTVEGRIVAIRDHLPVGNKRAGLWEEWLDYPSIPASVASRLNAEWASAMPASELALMRKLYSQRKGGRLSPQIP